ncbi:MAG: hypothetical protein KF901_06625 [Myxococcales bacterium]|nr:hypothetical protein [Myxococcales bacterium]
MRALAGAMGVVLRGGANEIAARLVASRLHMAVIEAPSTSEDVRLSSRVIAYVLASASEDFWLSGRIIASILAEASEEAARERSRRGDFWPSGRVIA